MYNKTFNVMAVGFSGGESDELTIEIQHAILQRSNLIEQNLSIKTTGINIDPDDARQAKIEPRDFLKIAFSEQTHPTPDLLTFLRLPPLSRGFDDDITLDLPNGDQCVIAGTTRVMTISPHQYDYDLWKKQISDSDAKFVSMVGMDSGVKLPEIIDHKKYTSFISEDWNITHPYPLYIRTDHYQTLDLKGI